MASELILVYYDGVSWCSDAAHQHRLFHEDVKVKLKKQELCHGKVTVSHENHLITAL